MSELFKSAITYLAGSVRLDPNLLAQHVSIGCLPTERRTIGFVAPLATVPDVLIRKVGKFELFSVRIEEKILPPSVIESETQKAIIDIQEKESRAVGRKERREVKERVILELLPKSFVKQRVIYGARSDKYLIINSATTSDAETVLELLRKAHGALPLKLMRTLVSIKSALSKWLIDDLAGELPEATLDDHMVFEKPEQGKPSVIFKKTSVTPQEAHGLLEKGFNLSRVGMTLRDHVSFLLDNEFKLRKIVLLDILKEKAEIQSETYEERFDEENLLILSQIEEIVDFLVANLGGLQPDD